MSLKKSYSYVFIALLDKRLNKKCPWCCSQRQRPFPGYNLRTNRKFNENEAPCLQFQIDVVC